MANKELKTSSENTNEESGGRRTFMKGMVAGSVAAGTLASTVAKAAPAQFATSSGVKLVAKARVPAAVLRLSFNQRKPPKIYDIQRALEEIIRQTGCEYCGLGGIDVILRLDEIINPADKFVAVVEGEILQG